MHSNLWRTKLVSAEHRKCTSKKPATPALTDDSSPFGWRNTVNQVVDRTRKKERRKKRREKISGKTNKTSLLLKNLETTINRNDNPVFFHSVGCQKTTVRRGETR